jgi:glycosyltransferase involved in cell wall biosynthesis
MACGVPCVATAVGDVASMVGDAGLVVPRENPQALSAAIRELVVMPEPSRTTLGLKGRVRIAESYSLETACKAYEDLYLSLCGRELTQAQAAVRFAHH